MVQATYCRHESWGLAQWRQAPLTDWRTGRTNMRAVGSSDSIYLGGMHVRTHFFLKQSGEGWLKLHWWLVGFPWPPQSTPAWAEWMFQPCLIHVIALCWSEGCMAENSALRRFWFWPEALCEQGGGSHYWHSQRPCIRSSLELWGWTTAACALTDVQSPDGPLLLQHCSQGCWCWDRGEFTLQGNRACLDLTLRASAPATWDLPALPLGQ